MHNTPHDRFAKSFLKGLLQPFGDPECSFAIHATSRHADIWFVPSPDRRMEGGPLGILGLMIASWCLIEPFRDPARRSSIQNCLAKLFLLYEQLKREASKEKRPLPRTALPRLWIIVPSSSDAVLIEAGADLNDFRQGWVSGVYFLPELMKTALVVLDRLPKGYDTLALRLMGRGRVQREALEELLALPETDPLKHSALKVLVCWRILLIRESRRSKRDEEMLMNYTAVYEEWEKKVREEARREMLGDGSLDEWEKKVREEARREMLGDRSLEEWVKEVREEGRESGQEAGQEKARQEMIEHLLKARFGGPDPELSRAVKPLMLCPLEELSHLVLTASREGILARARELGH